ncbi:MAG: site-2 protease family protein [Bradymonadaceae bacterium]|nr:site-2 protease family protein [Lujinxingiaceae bacterium]
MLFERSGLHLFTWRGIAVSVSMWYMILMAFIVFMPMMGSGTIISGVIFAVAVTLSLLVHEFGHGLVSKHYGLGPRILLHGFGGLCISDSAAQSDGDDARILLAGPFAGLAFGGLLIALQFFLPGVVGVSPLLAKFVGALIWINIVWSLVNLLLPIWPLDGGQLFHLILRRFTAPDKAQRVALTVSIFVVIPVAIVGFMVLKSLFFAILGLFILMDNVNTLQSGHALVDRAGSKPKKASSFHEELMREAEIAFKEQDWREAARLGHHMRSVGSMPNAMLKRVWTILGIATMELGHFDEALNYLERAPDTNEVRTAYQRCKKQLPGDAKNLA